MNTIPVSQKHKHKHLSFQHYEFIINSIIKFNAEHSTSKRNIGKTDFINTRADSAGTSTSNIYAVIKDATISMISSNLEEHLERPEHINARKEFGHWEGNWVTGLRDAQNKAYLTLIECKTRFYYMLPIPSKSAKKVYMQINKLHKFYGDNFSDIFKSITSIMAVNSPDGRT